MDLQSIKDNVRILSQQYSIVWDQEEFGPSFTDDVTIRYDIAYADNPEEAKQFLNNARFVVLKAGGVPPEILTVNTTVASDAVKKGITKKEFEERWEAPVLNVLKHHLEKEGVTADKLIKLPIPSNDVHVGPGIKFIDE